MTDPPQHPALPTRSQEPPVFLIVGCQRSGTTWLQRMLNAHPHLACTGETALGPVFTPLLEQFAQRYNQQQHERHDQFGPLPDYRCIDSEQLLRILADTLRMILTRHAQAEGKSCRRLVAVGEKTPEHAIYLNLFAAALPGLKVLHIVRDPRDVVVSGWFHNLRLQPKAFARRFPDPVAYARYTVERHWVPYTDAARGFGRQNPGGFREIGYEQLHLEPEPIVSSLLAWLGADADPGNVERCVRAASFRALSGGRSPGQEDRGSFFRKGNVGDYQDHLSPVQERLIRELVGNRFCFASEPATAPGRGKASASASASTAAA